MKTFIYVLLGICASFFIMTIVLWVSEVYDIYNFMSIIGISFGENQTVIPSEIQ